MEKNTDPKIISPKKNVFNIMSCAHRTGTGHYLFSTISSRHLDVARSPAPTLGAHTLVRLFVQFRVLSNY